MPPMRRRSARPRSAPGLKQAIQDLFAVECRDQDRAGLEIGSQIECILLNHHWAGNIRVRRRMSFTSDSAVGLAVPGFCLISTPW